MVSPTNNSRIGGSEGDLSEKQECSSVGSCPEVHNAELGEKSAVGAAKGIGSLQEKKLLRKLDWALLPLFSLIYCTNFIDRTAVG
jgi:hypothetical protein